MRIEVIVASSNDWCNALYFPSRRRKLGGVFCRLEPGHAGDHWCERQDEMAEDETAEDQLD